MKKYIVIFIIVFFGCNDQKLKWFSGSLEDAFLNQDNKIIMVDFYTDWCIPCKQIDSETFTNEEVIDKIEKNFIPIKINAESKYGLPLFEKYKGTGDPMILFLD